MTASTPKILYTGKTRTSSGGRDGDARSDDGRLAIQLSSPGGKGTGTNPEQLFAAGWSACFIGAMGLAASKLQVKVPADTAIDAEVDLANADGAYFLRARPAPTPRRSAATSTSRSPWSEPERAVPINEPWPRPPPFRRRPRHGGGSCRARCSPA